MILLLSCIKSYDRINRLDGVKLPVISSSQISNTTATSVNCTSTISSDGGALITAKGVVWSTNIGPTINLTTKISNGSGSVGSFSSSITGLQNSTTYYLRSYATNIAGTSYGPELQFKTLSTTPIINTTYVSNIMSISASSGGNITSDGGSPITARGVVWNTSPGPTISLLTLTKDSTGTGVFVSALKPLLPAKLYYARAYATNAQGTSYGNEIQFITASIIPSLTTTIASSILSTSATTGGSISSDGGSPVTARGVVWSTDTMLTTSLSTKTVNGSGVGDFISSISSLSSGTIYYIRAYATNAIGTAYGNMLSFKTAPKPSLASLTTNVPVSGITAISATCGGNILSDGGSPITARGVVWNTSPGPTVETSPKSINGVGTGPYSSALTPLITNTTYYVRAYATNSSGTAYGNEISFKTSNNLPTVITSSAINITSTSANLGGEVISDGGSPVTQRGIVMAKVPGPTTTSNWGLYQYGSGISTFSGAIASLTPGVTYYVRAYAINANGTVYGDEIFFTTLPISATVTTSSAQSIGSNTVILGGNVTNEGGASVTEKGVVWSTSSMPTTSNNKQNMGTGAGLFSNTITGLRGLTTYYVRAYAINSTGTSYGLQITFTTK